MRGDGLIKACSRREKPETRGLGERTKLVALVGQRVSNVGLPFERLENDGGLASYRDLIRHQRAQHEKQQRESSFTFALPEQVMEGRYLRVILLPDGETVHNAFFDRRFRP